MLSLSESPSPQARPRRGEVVAMFGCRGGCGATTLTVNLAAALARAGKEVCVVDFDLQLGDVLVALDLEPESSLAAVLRESPAPEGAALRRRLQRHAAGFYALSQSAFLAEIDRDLVDALPQLLSLLSSEFDVVLVDGLRDFGDAALAALDAASTIALVLTQDVAAVRRASRVLGVLRKLGCGDDKVRVVLNRAHRRARVKAPEVELALGLSVHAEVRNDYAATQAALTAGRLLPEVGGSRAIWRNIERLAVSLPCGSGTERPRPGAPVFADLLASCEP